MAGISTQTAPAAKATPGKEGPATSKAAASSPANKPAPVVARRPAGEPATREGVLSGTPIDLDLQADILRELGGTPDPVASDTEDDELAADEAEGSDASGAPEEVAANEEAAADEGAETDAETDGATAAELEAEADAEAGEEPAAELAPAEATAEDGTPPWAQKRFDELTRQVKERDRQIAALQQGQSQPPPAPLDPPLNLEAEFLQATTPESLGALRKRFEFLEDLGIQNPDGMEFPAKTEDGDPTVYSREQMAQLRVNARRALRLIPEREQQIKVNRQVEQSAHWYYPGFDSEDSDESKGVAFLLRQVPEIRRYAAFKQLVGDAIVGERLRIAKLKPAGDVKKGVSGQPLPGKPAAKPAARPATVPGAPHRAAATPAPMAAQIRSAQARARSSGSEADVASLLELTLSTRR